MRYYLDTNILIFFFVYPDEINKEVLDIIDDYENQLYVSSVCVQEMIHLLQSGKLKSKKIKQTEDVLYLIDQSGIKISPITEKHLKEYTKLPLYEGHNDPNDRVIIAQAISDEMPLISSDDKFRLYKKNKLNFIKNKR